MEREEMQATLRPQVVIREESDDFALLYDPDTGESFVLDPVGVFVCRRLDGGLSVEQIVAESDAFFDGVPEDAAAQVRAFVESLVGKNLAYQQSAG